MKGSQSNNNDTRMIEVDTLFIGGGPATLGVMTNAYQTSRLEDLLGVRTPSKGIAIVEAGYTFGGGNLQNHFGIKSNTSATGFLKILMYPKQKTESPQNAKSSCPPTMSQFNPLLSGTTSLPSKIFASNRNDS